MDVRLVNSSAWHFVGSWYFSIHRMKYTVHSTFTFTHAIIMAQQAAAKAPRRRCLSHDSWVISVPVRVGILLVVGCVARSPAQVIRDFRLRFVVMELLPKNKTVLSLTGYMYMWHDDDAKLEQTPRFLPRRRSTTSGSGIHSLLCSTNKPNTIFRSFMKDVPQFDELVQCTFLAIKLEQHIDVLLVEPPICCAVIGKQRRRGLRYAVSGYKE